MRGDTPAARGASTRRDLVVDRALDRARARADMRVQRFLDAARELMNTAPGSDVTVQKVVEQSGQSLRSFYMYFDGKHELMLAVLEQSVQMTEQHLREVVAAEVDPLERLHVAAVECYRLCAPGRKRGKRAIEPAAISEFAQKLLTTQPQEAGAVFGPLISFFEELLADASSAGSLRPGLRGDRLASIILQMLMFNRFATTISGTPRRRADDDAELVWRLLVDGFVLARK